MMNLDGKLPALNNLGEFSVKPIHIEGKSAGKGPLFRELKSGKPTIWAAHTHTANMLCIERENKNTLCNVGGGTKISKKTRKGLRKFYQIFVNVFHTLPMDP